MILGINPWHFNSLFLFHLVGLSALCFLVRHLGTIESCKKQIEICYNDFNTTKS